MPTNTPQPAPSPEQKEHAEFKTWFHEQFEVARGPAPTGLGWTCYLHGRETERQHTQAPALAGALRELEAASARFLQDCNCQMNDQYNALGSRIDKAREALRKYEETNK